jgi:hypothetical protein
VAGAVQSQPTERRADQSHHEGHDASTKPVASADTTVGSSHNQSTESRADQSRYKGHDGPASSGAGAGATGGAQSQPTDDHTDQSHQPGYNGTESPGAHGVNTDGRLGTVSSGGRGAADTDCDGDTEESRDKPVLHGFP